LSVVRRPGQGVPDLRVPVLGAAGQVVKEGRDEARRLVPLIREQRIGPRSPARCGGRGRRPS
jgi:hypothetical protein